MPSAVVRRRTARSAVAALAVATGVACATDGPTAPLTSYPCHVGWALRLDVSDPGNHYYDVLRDGGPSASNATPTVELGDSVQVSLVRADLTLDPSGLYCLETDTKVSTPWTLTAIDPLGALSIAQPTGTTPAMVRSVTPGPALVRAIVGHDSTELVWLSIIPRISSLVVTPNDTVDVGAAPVTVRIFARDTLGRTIPIYLPRTRWEVLETSTVPIALWPSASVSLRPNDPFVPLTLTFPSSATVGTVRMRFRTTHATALFSVTIPPVP